MKKTSLLLSVGLSIMAILSISCATTTSPSIKAPIITEISPLWRTIHKVGEVHVEENDPNTGKRITRVYKNKSKDCKVLPSGSKPWDWTDTGTSHKPGIQVADIKELVDAADIIILTKGMDEVLQTTPEAIEYLKQQKAANKIKEFYIEQTELAVAKYNELVKKGKSVAIIVHSTC